MSDRSAIARAALAQEREREATIRQGVRALNATMMRTRAAAIRAYSAGEDVLGVVRDELMAAVPTVQRGMTAAWMRGRLRSLLTAKVARSGLELADPFRVVLEFLQRKLDLAPAAILALNTEFGATSTAALANLADHAQRFVADAITGAFRDNLHVRGGVERIRQALDAAGVAPKADYALEAMFRTQHNLAYAAGRWQANQEPAVQDILWGYEYFTVGDNRVRPNHAAMEGTRAPKDDPVWRVIWPPNGYNCRCTTVEIFDGAENAVATGPLVPVEIGGVLVEPVPDPGFDFNPGEMFGRMQELAIA